MRMSMRWAEGIREKARKANAPIGPYLGLSFVVLVLFLFLPQFRTPLNLSNLLLRSIPLLAVAAGQTFVLIGAGIDLSVGSVISLSTCVASVTMEHNLILGIILTLASGMAVGAVNGIGVTKLRINPFLMTLGMTIIVSGISLLIRPYPGGPFPRCSWTSCWEAWAGFPWHLLRFLRSSRGRASWCSARAGTGDISSRPVATLMRLPWPESEPMQC